MGGCGSLCDEEGQRNAARRLQAVEELVTTERTYVSMLNVCVEEFMEPLADPSKKLMDASDHRTLFGDITSIRNTNASFLEDVEKMWANFDNNETKLSQLFGKWSPYFRQYQTYFNNYIDSNALWTRIKENNNKKFMKWYNEKRTLECVKGHTLEAFLICPIQRLPRYVILLAEIIKRTDDQHFDYNDLNRALTMIQETTSDLNRRMKEYENKKVVGAIEARIVNPPKPSLVQPHRSFVKEGNLTKINRKCNTSELICFLFCDLFVITSPAKFSRAKADTRAKMQFKIGLPIDDAFYVRSYDETNEKYRNCVIAIHSRVKSILVITETEAIKKEWMAAIETVLVELGLEESSVKLEEAAPLFIPLDWAQSCQVGDCGKKFGLTRRRKHCQYCGKVVCSDCSKNELKSSTELVKNVCKDCFRIYQHGFVRSVDARAKGLAMAELTDSEDEAAALAGATIIETDDQFM